MKVGFVHLGRESLGIEYLSAVLKRAGHETRLSLDPGLFGENDNVFYLPRLERFFEQTDQVLHDVVAWQPDLVAFSAYTNTYQWCLRMATAIRSKAEAVIVFGGIHCTLVPDVVIRNDCVDYVVVGEGEEAMVDLANALQHGAPTHTIPNVWTKQNGRIVSNDPRPPIADLDGLPFPDKALFEKDVNFEDDYLLLASRGCPRNCSYCCESFVNQLYHHHFFRRRSVDSVMAELIAMRKRYRFREVMFNDAIFFTDKKWLRELLSRFRQEIHVPFRCFGQVQFLDDEVAKMLKQGGCYCIEFGVQTMNERIRRETLRRRETNVHNSRAFRICDRYGLRYDIDHMFGLPGESESDHAMAARFYRGLKRLNRLKCHNLTCFPRTDMARLAREQGIIGEGDVLAMEQGRTGDFFHVDEIRDKDEQRKKAGFVALYKMLPLIPRTCLQTVLKHRWYAALRHVPGWLVVLSQVANALRARDYRFFLYFRYYFLRVRRSLPTALARIFTAPGGLR
jgi:anaerobic magnesium-protoporphyrin IX monomethyl ester cyclase